MDRARPREASAASAADVADAEAVLTARRARDRALTPEERIERLHVLCAALTDLVPVALPDLRGLLTSLVDARVEFVIVGGFAVVVHGFVRATEDLDIVPAPDRENLDRLVNRLVLLDGRLSRAPERALGPDERRALYRGRNLSVATSVGDLDVVQRLPGVPGFAALAERALTVSAFDRSVRVASRADLIAMKRARESALDLADLEYLETAP